VVAFPVSLQPYFLPFQEGGLAYDAVKAAFAAQGATVRPLFVSGRKIDSLLTEDTRADCVPMVSLGTEHGWHSAKKIRLLHYFVVTRPGVKMNSLKDLKRRRVLGYSGAYSYLGEEFRSEMKANPSYREIGNHRAQVRLLLQGTVEAIIADRLLVSWYLDYLREEGVTNTEVVFHDLFERVVHEFICRSPNVAKQFNIGLAQILEDGTLERILANYGSAQADAILLPLEAQSADSDRTGKSSKAADASQ
jgi:ABC-type amino acid transport substrate-binding protein